jgi:magnesium-transporting ATPase (P-type)
VDLLASQLVVGDVILVSAGDKVPTDGLFVRSHTPHLFFASFFV